MTDEINELKRKVAELEAKQQAPKPKPGGVPALKRFAGLLVIVVIGIAVFRNADDTTPRVATAADVKAAEKPIYVDMSPDKVAWRKKVMSEFRKLGVIYKTSDYEMFVQPDLFNAMPHDAKVGLSEAFRGTVKREFIVIVDSTTNKVIASYNPTGYGLKMGGGISNWAR